MSSYLHVCLKVQDWPYHHETFSQAEGFFFFSPPRTAINISRDTFYSRLFIMCHGTTDNLAFIMPVMLERQGYTTVKIAGPPMLQN